MVILMNEIINVKSQLKISLPIAFESLINILMTLVDTLVISMVGTTELAALGAMSVVLNLMQMSIQTINVSNNTLVAKALGKNDISKLKIITGNSIFKVLPLFIIGTYITMSATYYFSILRGIRDFKFLAQRNIISSVIKILVATILSFTSLGIVGVWIGYLVYGIVQKYLSKKRYKELANNI